jgi:membrane protein
MTSSNQKATAKHRVLLRYLKAIWDLLRAAYIEWRHDNAQIFGAALAFYTTISIAPLLIIVITVFGRVLGTKKVQVELLQRIQEAISPQAAQAVKMLMEALYPSGTGMIATAFAIGLILYGSTRAIVMLAQTLNLMWGVEPDFKVNVRHLIKVRIRAFVMVLVLGFLLLISLVTSTGLVVSGGVIGPLVPIPIWLLRTIDFFISLALVTLLFALIYKALADIDIAWKDVWIGSAITTALFTLGRLLLGLFFAHQQTASPHVAVTALVVLLWIYYCSQIVLFGAEITKVYVRWYKSLFITHFRLGYFSHGRQS